MHEFAVWLQRNHKFDVENEGVFRSLNGRLPWATILTRSLIPPLLAVQREGVQTIGASGPDSQM